MELPGGQSSRQFADLTNFTQPSTSGGRRRFGNLLDYWNSLRKSHENLLAESSVGGPMVRLYQAMEEGSRVYVVTRGMKEVRAILIGRLVAFDRYWNLVLAEVTECKTDVEHSKLTSLSGPGRDRRRRQRKLRRLTGRVESRPSDEIPEIPAAKYDLWDFSVGDVGSTTEPESPPDLFSMDADEVEVEKKEVAVNPAYEDSLVSRTTTSVQCGLSHGYMAPETSCSRRRVDQLFVRGANVVFVRVLPSPPAAAAEEAVE